MNTPRTGTPLVSAIVSTYNAERFMRGKLDDLEAQTMAGELEIIVVDSGSRQNERAIVEEFQRRYSNIRYIRTERRETVYQAWNRGIREARGEFIANANTDDRLRRDCYEILVRALREHPDCAVAYPDMRITLKENGTFDNHERFGFRDWPQFDRLSLLELCCVGPFPLWRKALHDEIGYFDERFKSAADYDFWLRAALRHPFIHVPDFLGLYWLSETTISRKGDLPTLEYLQVQREYRPKYAAVTPAPAPPTGREEAEYQAVLDRAGDGSAEGMAELESFVESHPNWARPHHDLAELYFRKDNIGYAKKHFEKAALLDYPAYGDKLRAFLRVELFDSLRYYTRQAEEENADPLETRLTLGMICLLLDRKDAARNYYLKALEIDPLCAVALENVARLDKVHGETGTVREPQAGADPSALVTSIVVVTSSELGCTKECLESIERNTPEPHEVIVVDTGSGDVTLPWLREFCAGKSGYRIIDNGGNPGFAAACELGIKEAAGGLILLLDGDVVVPRGWLAGMLRCLQREEGAAIVAPMSNDAAGRQCVSGTSYRSIEELEEFSRAFALDNEGRRLPADRVAGFCMLFTRALFDAVGAPDARFVSGDFAAEDFCLRAALAGYGRIIAGDVFVHHYGNRSRNGNGIGNASFSDRRQLEEKWDLARLDEALARKVVTRNALAKGRILAQQGRLNEAVELLLQEGIKFSPDSSEPYLSLAEILSDAGRFTDALDVLDNMPPTAEVEKLYLTALCRRGLGELPRARELVEQARATDPASPKLLCLLGALKGDEGEKGRAEEFFRAALHADPGFGPPRTELASLLWEKGARDEALALAEKGFFLSPLSMDALGRFHACATACGALPAEERRVREARAVYPDHKGLAYGLIEILIRQGRYRAAIDEIERAAVAFGLDDGAIDAALEIRRFAGDPPPAIRGAGTFSVCMIVKDEARHLPACLLSVKGFAGELIVVDTGSSDRTADIARIFGARLFSFPWNGSFSDARNVSISKAQGDWIMVLDADEVLARRDLAPLAELVRNSSPAAYSFTTRNYTEEIARKNWSANQGEYPDEERGRGWTPSDKVRLFPNDSRVRFEGAVHELLEPSLVRCKIPIRACDVPVHHYGRLDAAKTAEKREHYYLLGLRKMAETGGTVESLTELAVQATELERFAEAEELWSRVLRERPESVDAYFNLGYLHLATGSYAKAYAHAGKAAELAPSMKEAVFNLAKCELFLGLLPQALRSCGKMLREWPDYPPALSLLSVITLLAGKRGEAETLVERLRAMGYDCCDFLREYADGLGKGEHAELAAPVLAFAEEINLREGNGDGKRYCHG